MRVEYIETKNAGEDVKFFPKVIEYCCHEICEGKYYFSENQGRVVERRLLPRKIDYCPYCGAKIELIEYDNHNRLKDVDDEYTQYFEEWKEQFHSEKKGIDNINRELLNIKQVLESLLNR